MRPGEAHVAAIFQRNSWSGAALSTGKPRSSHVGQAGRARLVRLGNSLGLWLSHGLPGQEADGQLPGGSRLTRSPLTSRAPGKESRQRMCG